MPTDLEALSGKTIHHVSYIEGTDDCVVVCTDGSAFKLSSGSVIRLEAVERRRE